MNDLFDWSLPSKYKLESLIGCKIHDMIKYSYESFQEFEDYFESQGYSGRLSFFKYSYGGLLLIFDNEVEYSFGSAEDLNSLIVCCQRNKSGEYNPSYRLEDVDVRDKTSVKFINNAEEYFFLLNQKIIKISILTIDNLEGKAKDLPSEKGLEFVFENGKKLILSHHLTENSFVFGVLTESDKISEHTIIKQIIKS